MAVIRVGGAGIGLSVNNGLATSQGAQVGITNAITMPAASIYNMPAGTFLVRAGAYTSLQFYDPVSTIWRSVSGSGNREWYFVDSDGGNFRLANLTGCPIGALITTAGSAYTNGIGATATGLSFTVSGGSSVWQPVVGGAVNSTVTITTAGSGYLYPPILIFDAPPVGGIQATGLCTISGGVINAVTITNQGAGYITPPNITLVNDPRDTAGAGGVLTVNATLAGSGIMTALYPTNPGTVLTSVPTLTASSGSAAATVIMNFVVTGYTVSASGAGYKTSQPIMIMSQGGIVAGTRATNAAGPIADTGLTQPRMAQIAVNSTTGGKVGLAANAVIGEAGFGLQAVPNAIVLAGGTGLATTQGQVTLTVGGITDTSFIQPV